MGAHSLDQIIFGSINGLIEGLILHFVVRDHVIKHIEKVLGLQGQLEEERNSLNIS